MKIFVEITEEGAKHSARGLRVGLRGTIQRITDYFSDVTVKFEDGTWGRYDPNKMHIKIVGFSNDPEGK
jgi:hypothetical protein